MNALKRALEMTKSSSATTMDNSIDSKEGILQPPPAKRKLRASPTGTAELVLFIFLNKNLTSEFT